MGLFQSRNEKTLLAAQLSLQKIHRVLSIRDLWNRNQKYGIRCKIYCMGATMLRLTSLSHLLLLKCFSSIYIKRRQYPRCSFIASHLVYQLSPPLFGNLSKENSKLFCLSFFLSYIDNSVPNAARVCAL